MSRCWIVVDTNVFCLTDPGRKQPRLADLREAMILSGLMREAVDFLERMIEFCEEYGLALDREGLILEEYEREIYPGSFGWYALQEMLKRIPGKVAFFEHKNPVWLEELHGCDKHDRRFVATALATPDKVLISQDSVFHDNAEMLRKEGLRLFDVEEADIL